MFKLCPFEDRQGNTVINVQFYYTPEFAAATSDPAGYIAGLVTNANTGYANSGVIINFMMLLSKLG